MDFEVVIRNGRFSTTLATFANGAAARRAAADAGGIVLIRYTPEERAMYWHRFWQRTVTDGASEYRWNQARRNAYNARLFELTQAQYAHAPESDCQRQARERMESWQSDLNASARCQAEANWEHMYWGGAWETRPFR